MTQRIHRHVALFVLLLLSGLSACSSRYTQAPPIIVAAERAALYLPSLRNQRVALVVNQSSMVKQQHLVDYLLEQEVNITRIFAPEHGFRGDHDAGAVVASSIDHRTGIPISSIYGKNKKPPAEQLADVDVIVFDIQDVGARFYTYISSLHYMMEAAAESGLGFLVLDRPNPNGRYVSGPIREAAFQSFVGLDPLPVLHGMTVAELARMIKGEQWIAQAERLQLLTIPVANYRRDMPYRLPIAPSPNLPNAQAIQLYPSLCFFEATPMSVGRGTDFPFQVIGHGTVKLGEFAFTPVSMPGSALHPKLEDVPLLGRDLRQSVIHGLDLSLLVEAYQAFSTQNKVFFERADFMDKLAGTDKLRLAIEAGQTAMQIEQSWQPELIAFRAQRRPYLLYPDYD
ncbi:MAG: DUF1343 domain-containing protein [Paraglaciecola sp.]|nr:DUF1343 domain-containing protein [Paraglaciecola sp.]NCT46999.1 DUF1343 domain-containing protein [Paraglaciecola sp.]